MMKRLGNIFILLGLLLIAGALALFFYNRSESRRAGEAAAELRDRLAEQIEEGDKNPFGGISWRSGAWDSTDREVVPDMPEETIDGYSYVGIIDIPTEDISLPVMADWDYARLTIAPCRYSGSYYTDDLVICAHNYGKHFAPIRWADIGADVYFTAVDGVVYHYIIANRETVQPTDVDAMIDSEADWDLTLFTCNLGGQTRCAVRCVLISDIEKDER